jgi:uncharacterized protein YukE
MGNIHVDTDKMRQLAGSLEWWSGNLRDNMMPTLHTLTSQLEGDWLGANRQHYEQLFQTLQSNASILINSTEDLGTHLMNTANQLESVDNS